VRPIVELKRWVAVLKNRKLSIEPENPISEVCGTAVHQSVELCLLVTLNLHEKCAVFPSQNKYSTFTIHALVSSNH